MAPLLCPVDQAVIGLPATVGDYTDFYVGIHHARPSGSCSGPTTRCCPTTSGCPSATTDAPRPCGPAVCRSADRTDSSSPGRPRPDLPSRRASGLRAGDRHLGGSASEQGHPVPIDRAADHIAGYCLLNDWSTRDVQSWEYQPLGPFLSKNFATTVSAWVVTPEALAPYRGPLPARPEGDPDPLPYLAGEADQRTGGLDLGLEVLITTSAMRSQGMEPHRLATSSTQHMYWTPAQLIAHHTSGGCDLRSGDLLGSGTLSAPVDTGYGCCWR